MAEMKSPIPIYPGKSLGWMILGTSLHGIMSRLKAQPQSYPRLDLSYSLENPISDPIVLTLSANGIRLRFDGPDQRLRLIEIIDFNITSFSYKSSELVRRPNTSSDGATEPAQGPSFRHIYNRVFGPSYPGEYIAPRGDRSMGIYVLSYPGLSVRFPLKHSAWSEKADFVSLLSSSAALPATSLAIFSGQSWPEVSAKLFTSPPPFPRSTHLAAKSHENIPDEVEEVQICGNGKVELRRRASPTLTIILNETSPQDLIAELGPPDAIFHKSGSRLAIHAGASSGRPKHSSPSPSFDSQKPDADYSSARSYTDESDPDLHNISSDEVETEKSEQFYNYFNHGFDVLISPPSHSNMQGSKESDPHTFDESSELVVTKLLLHGNIPGSYCFNRHRRCRWIIQSDLKGRNHRLTSEMKFNEVSSTLKEIWRGSYSNPEQEEKMQRGMVLNRGWGESPESSIELLGGFEESPTRKPNRGVDSLPNMNNTELFGFPGMLFEVLKDNSIACLTVY